MALLAAPGSEALELSLERLVVRPGARLGVVVTQDGRALSPAERARLRLEVTRVGDGSPVAAVAVGRGRTGDRIVVPRGLRAPCYYDLVAWLPATDDRVPDAHPVAPAGTRARTRFAVHRARFRRNLPPIRVAAVRADGVVLINGAPFFAFDLLHGSSTWLRTVPKAERWDIQEHLADIRAHGFNVLGEGGGRPAVDEHWRRHNLYTLDRQVGAGLGGGGSGTIAVDPNSIARAVDGLRSAGTLHPGWLGGGIADEPDLALDHGLTAAALNAGLDRLAAAAADRLVHAELSVDGASAATRLRSLDALTIGFSSDPAAVARLAAAAVRVASGRQPPAAPWATIQILPLDDPAHLLPAPSPWQVRAAALAAVASGATGLEFYPYHQGEFVWRRSPQVWQLLPVVLEEVAEIAANLVLPLGDEVAIAWHATDEGDIAGLRVRSRGTTAGVTILAVNTSTDATRVTFSGAFDGATQAVIPFEDRSVPIRNGRFTDDFGPWQGRAYQIRRQRSLDSDPRPRHAGRR